MLPTTTIKVDGTELTVLVDKRASIVFCRHIGANKIALKSIQERTLTRYIQPWAKEMESKEAQTNVEIAGFIILHTFLIGGISANCILDSDFLAKIAT